MLTICEFREFVCSNLVTSDTLFVTLAAALPTSGAKSLAVVIRIDANSFSGDQELEIEVRPVWPSSRASLRPGANVLTTQVIDTGALATNQVFAVPTITDTALGDQVDVVLRAKQATSGGPHSFTFTISLGVILYEA